MEIFPYASLYTYLVNRALFALEDRSRHGIPVYPFLAAKYSVGGATLLRGQFHSYPAGNNLAVCAEERGHELRSARFERTWVWLDVVAGGPELVFQDVGVGPGLGKRFFVHSNVAHGVGLASIVGAQTLVRANLLMLIIASRALWALLRRSCAQRPVSHTSHTPQRVGL